MGCLIYFAVLRQGIQERRVFSSICRDFSMVIKQRVHKGHKQSHEKALKRRLEKLQADWDWDFRDLAGWG
jgi:hypothetical protein